MPSSLLSWMITSVYHCAQLGYFTAAWLLFFLLSGKFSVFLHSFHYFSFQTGSYSVPQAGLEFSPPASASWLLWLQVGTIMLDLPCEFLLLSVKTKLDVSLLLCSSRGVSSLHLVLTKCLQQMTFPMSSLYFNLQWPVTRRLIKCHTVVTEEFVVYTERQTWNEIIG